MNVSSSVNTVYSDTIRHLGDASAGTGFRQNGTSVAELLTSLNDFIIRLEPGLACAEKAAMATALLDVREFFKPARVLRVPKTRSLMRASSPIREGFGCRPVFCWRRQSRRPGRRAGNEIAAAIPCQDHSGRFDDSLIRLQRSLAAKAVQADQTTKTEAKHRHGGRLGNGFHLD